MTAPETCQPEYANDDGWTDWIHPLPGYRMQCCDCGLVHVLELRVDDIGQPNFRMRLVGHDAAREEKAPTLPAAAGVCAYDRDECTVTLALSSEEEVMDLVLALPLCGRLHVAASGSAG